MERFTKCLLLLALFFSVSLEVDSLRKGKQVGTGVTFAFPGLNLLAGAGLGGNNNNNGGNFFGQQTFTRTLVSTVSTVTTASFRTCTTSAAALMPCAGRRKRDVENELGNELATDDVRIEPTASIALIIGTTTLTDPMAVSEYLVAHQPSTNSIIYPPGVVISEVEKLASVGIDDVDDHEQPTTVLYPSSDSVDEESLQFDPQVTTENPNTFADEAVDAEGTTPKISENGVELEEKARVGLGKTTVTTVIRVTSVATTIATGMMATLTVMYAGCMPPTFPVSGLVCT